MKEPHMLVSEMSYCDETTHLFHECRMIKKAYERRVLGVYGQRLDSCNMKFRFAAKSYLEVMQIFDELEHGEFIYFDDKSRLEATFYFESLVIFIRASLDLAISAYYVYFTGKTNLDSLNDFLKKLDRFLDWIPESSKSYWQTLNDEYASDYYGWLHALAGKNKGMSLRDIAVHKSLIEIDTAIDDRDKGWFYINLGNYRHAHAKTVVNLIYENARNMLDRIKEDIIIAERLANAAA